MNRNVEAQFAELPQVDIQRSRFDRSFSHKTSFNVGELIPFYVEEVLPGDTFQVSTSAVVRLQTLLTPIMDNVYMDTYFFYVPGMILWEHYKQFFGENTNSAWYPSTEYQIPQLQLPANGFDVGTIADYMGVPTGVGSLAGTPTTINALPFRAFAEIFDTWFRDQNITDPLLIPHGDQTEVGSNGDNYIVDTALGGKPPKVAKYHDYFTSCLPSPQKGPAVSIFGDIPSIGASQDTSNWSSGVPVHTGVSRNTKYGVGLSGFVGDNELLFRQYADGSTTAARYGYFSDLETHPELGFEPTNLWADLNGVNLTINQLRLAFQLQKFYERCARGGTRYRELIKAHFGVTSADASQYIPEYLGGHRFPLSIHQVANQSQGENDFLGDLGAMSNTYDYNDVFIKSFDRHGYVIGCCCVRYDHSYPQGLNKMWMRRSMLDFYFPVFANIGERAVNQYEIMLTDSNANATEIALNPVFGYNEAWSEYRFAPNRVSGEMRPSATNSLASWHLADNYDEPPTLSDGWIREDKANVDRVLAVTSSVSNQVFCDFYIKNIATRPMPMYSIPGLIDHN